MKKKRASRVTPEQKAQTKERAANKRRLYDRERYRREHGLPSVAEAEKLTTRPDCNPQPAKPLDPNVEAKLKELAEKKIELLQQINNYKVTHQLECFKPHSLQVNFFEALRNKEKTCFVLLGGNRCLAPWEPIYNPLTNSFTRIDQLTEPHMVLALDAKSGKLVPAAASPSFPKGLDYMYRVTLSDGSSFTASDRHRILDATGVYRELRELRPGSAVYPPQSNLEFGLSIPLPNERHSTNKAPDSQADCLICSRSCGARPQSSVACDPDAPPSPADAQAHICPAPWGDQDYRPECNHRHHESGRPSTQDAQSLIADPFVAWELATPHPSSDELPVRSFDASNQSAQRIGAESDLVSDTPRERFPVPLSCGTSLTISTITCVGMDVKWDFTVPEHHNYYHQGTIHHNSGKTTSSVVAAISLALGYYPWEPKDKDPKIAQWLEGCRRFHEQPNPEKFAAAIPHTLRFKPPVKIRILGEDATALEQVTIPKLKQYMAPEWLAATKKNNLGLPAHWVFQNGSTIDLLTYNQDPSMMEGWDGHVILFDEPPPRPVYIANTRGLIDHGGISIFSMTPLKEAWISDEIVTKPSPSIWVQTMATRDNPHLDPKAITEFEEKLSPEERETRMHGKFLHLQGLVFKEFDREKHICPNFVPDHTYTVYVSMDTHPRTEQAISFVAVDRRDRMFVVHEVFKHMTPEQVAATVIEFHTKIHPIEYALIDPSSKGDSNRGDSTFEVIDRELAHHCIPLDLGSKDMSSGILLMHEALMSRNQIPSLFFCESAQRHIWEMLRYTWQDWKGTNKQAKTELNKPIDKDDHLIEALRRLIQLPATWVNPARRAAAMAHRGFQPTDPEAGY